MILDSNYSLNKLKQLKARGLELLAKEIRDKIIKVVSQNGGHLASNLGAVELAIALHFVFDSPNDKIIWDVGHQAYAHKILTDRNETFHTIRLYGGLSSFLKISESPHDIFGVGHSSTSISAAIGIKKGMVFNGDTTHKVVAVIGDGALTGGMAFEAINFLGQQKDDVLIILNTNDMSIAPNVGALSEYLTRIIRNPIYNKVKSELFNLTERFPGFSGKTTRFLGKKAEETIKSLLTPGAFFEELGLKYFGPIDGHNITLLINTLNDIKNIPGPKILQVKTQKGKGYKFAEENATKYHGVGQFKVDTGESIKKKTSSYTEIFGKKMAKLAVEDEKIVGITAAMPDGTGLNFLRDSVPDRFFDAGIAEQHATTFAAGLAVAGMKPFLAIYSTFLQRAYDQVIHDIVLQNLPVRICIDRAGVVGEDGPTHHGVFDLSYLLPLPGLVIMSPKDQIEFEMMIDFMASYDDGPIAVRYPRGKVVDENELLDSDPLEKGKMEVLKQGKKILFIAFGRMVYPAYNLAIKLDAEKNTDIEVINLRFAKPIDEMLIDEIKKFEYVFTFEENALIGGIGNTIDRLILENKINDIKVKNFAIPDEFVQHGRVDILLDSIGLSIEKLEESVLKELNEI